MSLQGSPPRVLVAPDKLKGSVRADEAARALAAGIRSAEPTIDVCELPVADGGEGTVHAAVAAGFQARTVEALGPTSHPVRADIAVRGGVAVVESAAFAGLELLPSDQLDPMGAHSFGVGQAVAAALDLGAREVVLGLGGTACTDGGAGMLQALGLRLLDDRGADLPLGGGSLALLERVDVSGLHPRVRDVRIVIATDVDNPLTGPAGAAAVFAPQKGADRGQVRLLEHGLKRLADLTAAATGARWDDAPGAGAAGGLGFAAVAYLGGRRVSGAQIVLDLLGLPEAVHDADLVITAEGRLDGQSLRGKAPVEVAREAASARVPVVAVVGSCTLAEREWRGEGISAVYELMTLAPDVETSRRDAARLLAIVGEQIVRDGWARSTTVVGDADEERRL